MRDDFLAEGGDGEGPGGRSLLGPDPRLPATHAALSVVCVKNI